MTTPTTNYSWGKPINGADSDTWGTELNTLIDAIDTQVKAVSDSVTTASGLAVQRASNLSDIASASAARGNLGVTATGQDTTYCYRANNLSDVTAATARTNLGLGTAAVENVATFLLATNNLAELPNKLTARNNLQLGNIATTTYFVQSGGSPSSGAGSDGDLYFIY